MDVFGRLVIKLPDYLGKQLDHQGWDDVGLDLFSYTQGTAGVA